MKTIYLYSIFIIFLCIRTVEAQSLDNSFGTNGKVHTSFGNFSTYFNALAMQNDGKIYAVGAKEGSFSETNGIFISRYNTDGLLDISYNSTGVNGASGTKEIGYGSSFEFCHTAVLQPDNKLIVAGSSNGSFSISRLLENGDYDTDFSGDGKMIYSFGTGNGSKINKILLQSDGKILAIGQAYSGTDYDFGAARFNTDGSLDTTFGVSGKVRVAIGPANDFGQDAVLQPDGKIVITGYSKNALGYDTFSAIRLNNDGSLDINFATNGKIYFNIPSKLDCVAEAVTLQLDGRILIAGHADGDFAVLRYNTNGTLDNSFGNSGYTTTDFGNSQDKVYAISIQANGKIIIAGNSYDPLISTFLDFGIASYNADGSLDNTFDTDGKMTISMGYSSGIKDMIIQNDGKLIFGGYSTENQNSNTRYSLLRLNAANLSINENLSNNNSKVSLYPNPTNQYISIMSTMKIENIELFNIHGQQVDIKNKIINNTIDLSEFGNGIYFIKLNSNQTFKIIKSWKLWNSTSLNS